MHAWIFVFLLAAIQLSPSASYYHVLVADDRPQPFADESLNSLSSHLRLRRSLIQPDDILSSLTADEASGDGDGSDYDEGDIQTFQFFVKNYDTANSAQTTISEMMPGNAILMDFSIHNEGKTYSFNKQLARSVEEAADEFQNSVSSRLSAVMLGDVKTSIDRCSDCRVGESDQSEGVNAVISVAPGDIFSISLSYLVPRRADKILIGSEKEMYRTDTTIDLEKSATKLSAVIMSPNYPADYPNNADLTWFVSAPTTDMTLSAEVLSFSSEACCDHLYIYDGPTDSYPLLYVISGEVSTPEYFNTTGPSMFLKFQSDSLVTAGGFTLQFHPTAPVIDQEVQIDEDKTALANYTLVLQNDTAFIKTPNYPETYMASSTLTWDIVVGVNYALDFYIKDFDILEGETLEVIDTNTTEVYLTLGSDTNTPYNFHVSTNEVQLVFHSLDKVIPKRGIYAQYFSRLAEQVSINSSDPEWHTISSPYYPQDYSSNEYLVWIVTLDDPTSFVRIEVVSLNLERGYDFLVLYSGESLDGNKKLATLSGTDGQGIEFMSSENSAMIVFNSDRSITDSGFQLRFRNFMVNTECSSATDVIQNVPSGMVRNSNYPSTDYIYYACQWLIEAKETNLISVFLEKLSYSYSYTYLTFYDGDSTSHPVLWSGSSANFDSAVSVTSSSNKMLARIHNSYYSYYYVGYAFRFQEVVSEKYPMCQDTVVFNAAPGQIKSPQYPLLASNIDCTWLIQAPSGYKVLVTIQVIYSMSSSSDPMNFYDGTLTSDPFLTNCGSCSAGTTISSTTNSMLIETSIYSGMFKLVYEFVAGSTSLMNKDIGFATSPSFPDDYPTGSYDVTLVEVTTGRIMFYFETFETEECCDVLNIYDGDSTSSPLIASLKGDHQGFESQTTGRYLSLEFTSDDSNSASGYKMDYCSTDENCQFSDSHNTAYSYNKLTDTDSNHYLGSPSSSGFYPILTDFHWYIECSCVTTQIQYNFERLDLDNTDSLILYNDFSMDDDNVALQYPPSSGNNYNDYRSGKSVSGDAPRNVLWFHSDAAYTGMGFYLSYYCDT